MRRMAAALLVFAMTLGGGAAGAHDPSAYGGMFRSRNLGGSWLNADVGLFLNAVLTVAVDPSDPAHLLMGTELGVMRSRNGGRSWSPEAVGMIVGAVFALAFTADGRTAIAGAPSGVFRHDDGKWSRASAPDDATPSRGFAIGAKDNQIFLLGRRRLFSSEDRGQSYARIAHEIPDASEMTAVVIAGDTSHLLAIVDGKLMASHDGGRRWQARAVTSAEASARRSIDTIALDPASPTRIWVGVADRLHVSDDVGETWRAVGRPLPEAGTIIRGIAADSNAMTLNVTSHRGMFRSEDGGDHWTLKEGNLPVHLEAGPLFRDPSDAYMIYAVYSLLPYAETWRIAIEGSSLLARVDRVSLLGGLAFMLLMMLCGWLSVRWLNSRRSSPLPPRRGLS